MKGIGAFFLRFLFWAPLCLAMWWLALPAYAWAIGTVAGCVARPFATPAIEGMRVESAGILHSGSLLAYRAGGRERSMAIGDVTVNAATYTALVLATGGLAWKRRIKAWAIGCAVLAAGHVAYVALALVFVEGIRRFPEAPTALAQFFITLPFLLWVLLACPELLSRLFGAPRGAEACGDDENASRGDS